MAPHDGTTISPLVSIISAIVLGVGIGWTALRTYLRERKEPSSGKDIVLASATFADRKIVDRLIDALDRNESAANREAESNHAATDDIRRLRKSVDELVEAVRASTDSTLNLAAWLKSRPGSG